MSNALPTEWAYPWIKGIPILRIVTPDQVSQMGYPWVQGSRVLTLWDQGVTMDCRVCYSTVLYTTVLPAWPSMEHHTATG